MLDVHQVEQRLKSLEKAKKRFSTVDVSQKDLKVLQVGSIEKANWFISKDYTNVIKINKNVIELEQPVDKFIYISYQERNNSYHVKPKKTLFEIDYKKPYQLEFSGVKSGSGEAHLYFIMYKENGAASSIIVPVGEMKIFTIPTEVVSVRLAVKFIGEVRIEFQNILLSKQVDTNKSIRFIEENKVDNFIKYVNKVALKDRNKHTVNKEMKIATILDEFSSECFKYEANLLPLTPKNWRQVIDEENPALLLVESAWQGYKGTWYCRITELHKRSYTDLQDLVSYCKERGIPTIFWDKEGKDNFESFKEAASYFDYIFVTDENNIDNFKTVVTHTNIYPLSFAAQPRIHNPINKNKHKLGTIAFSGSWYGDKHPDRIKDVENIITPATRIGLDIYDRFFGIDNKNLTSRTWPELFQNSIVGKLDYNFMVEAYKNYDIFLNVNSIQNSKYMFSRRVYEVLASKTVVVSGDSIGVREQLGDYVHISDSPARTELLLRILTQSPLKMQREAKLAHRFILQNHTYTHRINEMLDIVGLPYKKSHSKKISVVLVTNRPQFMDNILDNLSAQTYEDREHIIVVNSDDIVMEKWEKKFSSLKNTKIYKVASAKSLGYCLNYGISKSIGDVIAKMDDDDYYAPNYLRDMVAIFDYTDASIVGKSVYYTYFEESNILVKRQIKGSGEDCYTRFVAGATLMFKREVYEAMGSFENRNTGEDTKFIEYAIKLGFKIYSDDSYNFCVIRRKEKNSHTWQISDEDMLKQGTICAYTNDYKTFVTI